MSRDREYNRAQRERVIAKRMRFKKELGLTAPGEPGTFAKRHPLDCGVPQCGVCHHEKKFRLKRKEERAYEDERRCDEAFSE